MTGHSFIRMNLYKILTQSIIILGRLRTALKMPEVIRNDRVFVDPNVDRIIGCCDCGLEHYYYPVSEKHNLVKPLRIMGYDYGMRKFAEGGEMFGSEKEALYSISENILK